MLEMFEFFDARFFLMRRKSLKIGFETLCELFFFLLSFFGSFSDGVGLVQNDTNNDEIKVESWATIVDCLNWIQIF